MRLLLRLVSGFAALLVAITVAIFWLGSNMVLKPEWYQHRTPEQGLLPRDGDPWGEERFSYEGKFHSFPEVMVIPKPVQKPHPPIWMAVTHSPESVDVAVSHRWGLFTVGSSFFPASAESDQDLIKLYYSKMRDAGVASQNITIAAVRNMFVAESEAEALEVMTPRLQWAGDMGEFLPNAQGGLQLSTVAASLQ